MACWRLFLTSYIIEGVLQLLPLMYSSHVLSHISLHGALKGSLFLISVPILPPRLAGGSSQCFLSLLVPLQCPGLLPRPWFALASRPVACLPLWPSLGAPQCLFAPAALVLHTLASSFL